MSNKTKLVVIDDNTLGYINPSSPGAAWVLASSVIGGSIFRFGDSVPLGGYRAVRLASEQDFHRFRVDFTGYKNDDSYEYDRTQP